jgi:tartrate dehydratase alpha subunit/fumarate hydratase class I-like protein
LIVKVLIFLWTYVLKVIAQNVLRAGADGCSPLRVKIITSLFRATTLKRSKPNIFRQFGEKNSGLMFYI